MAITLDGTSGITTPDITSEAGLTVDGVSFASGAPANTLVTTSGGDVGIGTSSPAYKLDVSGSGSNTSARIRTIYNSSGNYAELRLASYNDFSGIGEAYVRGVSTASGNSNTALSFGVNASGFGSPFEAMRVDDSGNLLVGTTSNVASVGSASGQGVALSAGSYGGYIGVSRNAGPALEVQRQTDDGVLVNFFQAGTVEGSISVSGSTVSYNGGHLARWSQLADNTRDETILKGTVMTNLDQMAEWTTDGVTEANEQLNCMAVSSVEGDPNVAGVFVNWDNDDDVYTNDMNIAMTGDMIIRIAAGTTVARGDLLMSAGDGTAKPQGDDIVRSKTIAKVTSTHVTCTYDDGSYCVPCVLMAC
jgi:hypothetical protein